MCVCVFDKCEFECSPTVGWHEHSLSKHLNADMNGCWWWRRYNDSNNTTNNNNKKLTNSWNYQLLHKDLNVITIRSLFALPKKWKGHSNKSLYENKWERETEKGPTYQLCNAYLDHVFASFSLQWKKTLDDHLEYRRSHYSLYRNLGYRQW